MPLPAFAVEAAFSFLKTKEPILMKQNEMSFDSQNIEAIPVYEETSSYQVGKMTFMVNRVFQKDGADSVGAILIRLMKSEPNLPKKCS